MLYVYYKSDGTVDSIMRISPPKASDAVAGPPALQLKPKDNMPADCKCLTLKEDGEYDLPKYSYTVVDGELVQGTERIAPNTGPDAAERLTALENAILTLM